MMTFEKIDTACLNLEDVPWIPFTPYSDVVHLKYFKIDPVRGETITLLRAPAGFRLPKHHHTGTVIVYTVQGSWRYLEHDWVAHAGSVVYETASTSHTPMAIDGQSGSVVTFNITQGELVFLDESDRVMAVESWRTSMQRYLDYCRANDLKPRDLSSFAV